MERSKDPKRLLISKTSGFAATRSVHFARIFLNDRSLWTNILYQPQQLDDLLMICPDSLMGPGTLFISPAFLYGSGEIDVGECVKISRISGQ